MEGLCHNSAHGNERWQLPLERECTHAYKCMRTVIHTCTYTHIYAFDCTKHKQMHQQLFLHASTCACTVTCTRTQPCEAVTLACCTNQPRCVNVTMIRSDLVLWHSSRIAWSLICSHIQYLDPSRRDGSKLSKHLYIVLLIPSFLCQFCWQFFYHFV